MVPPLTGSESPSESFSSPSLPLRTLSKRPRSMGESAWCKPRNRREVVTFDLCVFVAVSRGKGEFALSAGARRSSCRIPLAILLASTQWRGRSHGGVFGDVRAARTHCEARHGLRWYRWECGFSSSECWAFLRTLVVRWSSL